MDFTAREMHLPLFLTQETTTPQHQKEHKKETAERTQPTSKADGSQYKTGQ